MEIGSGGGEWGCRVGLGSGDRKWGWGIRVVSGWGVAGFQDRLPYLILICPVGVLNIRVC